MESDLPLMEDDVQQFPDPNQTPSKSSLNYFNCSHFKLPPSSHTKNLTDGVHLEKPSSSSSATSNNKENINSNNVEVPRLGMGPMQMKKRKKGGGYNLRKSLAWDRAFFTDEGILDPLELTLITGINANTCGEGLHTISEEGNTDTRCTKGPKNKETSEEVLLKELHDKSRTSKVKGEKTGCSVGNHDSSPHRKVTHKFLSIDRTNRAGSKVGVPEPLAASSLKRPANSNTLKTAKKESKLPKLPMSKPGSFYSATTKVSTTASQLRHNLIPKPTINVQKNVSLKSSVKNAHGSQSKAKTGSGSLRLPIKEPAKKTTNSSSKPTPTTKSQLVQVDRANSGSEVVPDRFQLCEIQEGSAPLAAKNQAQHTATSVNTSLPEAARLTSSGPCHIERASNDLIILDRLHPCDNQAHCATLASSHHMNLHNTGMYPTNTQPVRPSGLRLPSPSLRFFDQKTALESGSSQQKKIQLHSTNMGSNRKIGELRPPAATARTPMKSNDITENVCSVVPTSSGRCLTPSTLSTHCGSTQLIPLPNYLGSTTNGVPDSDIYPNLERKIMQREDVKMQYECRSSEVEVHKVTEQEERTIGRYVNMKMEKFAWNDTEEIKETHLTEQLGEGIGANIHLVGNEGNNKVGVGNREVMSQGNGERVTLVPETKGRLMLHNEEDRLHNYTAISASTSGQSIQHQEQNISTAVDGNTNFMQDLARTSSEQADTKKSDASKVNLESHLDAGSPMAEDQVSKVFAESQKDGLGKCEDDVGATKWVGPGSENCSVVLQHIEIGQENDVAKVVDELYKSSFMNDDVGFSADSPCNETKGIISITSRESLKDEAGNGGDTDARQLKGTVTMLDTSGIPFQSMDTEQGNDDADNVPVFPTRPSIRDAGTLVLHDHSSAEGFYINPSTSIENKVQLLDSPMRDAVMLVQHDNPSAESFHINTSTSFKNEAQLQDSGTANQSAKCFETTIPCVSALPSSQFCSEGWSVNCILPAESSSLEEGSCDNVTEMNDYCFPEKGRSNFSNAILMEVPDQKQDGVDVEVLPGRPFAEAQLEFHNHSSLSRLSPEVELNSGTASVNDDAFCMTESVLQVDQCASTYPQSLEKEGLNLAAATTEAEFKIDEENQKSQETGIIISSLSKKSIVAEESQDSCGNMMKANATIQGCTSGKAAPLIDDHNHSSLSCLRPEVELISGFASVDDAFFETESVVQVAQCVSTYLQNLEKEGLSLAAATTEAEFKTDEENQKSQEMGIIIRSLSKKSIVAEESQHSCGNMMEANATIQDCTGGLETYNEFQIVNNTLEGSEIINNFPKTHVEDAQMQLLDGDILVRSCSSLTSPYHSIQNVGHSDIFEEQPEVSDTCMKLEQDLISNHQLLPTTDSFRQECVCKGVMNVVDQSDVCDSDRKPSNTIIHSPPVGQAVGLHHNNNGQLCDEYGTSGSTAIDSIAEHNENYSDRQFTYNTECSDLALLSELDSSGNNEMVGVNTCMEYCSAGEESCSFLRKVADSMLEEKPTLFGDFVDIRQVAADNKQVCMKGSLSPEKNANLDKPDDALDIVIVGPEQSISHGCDSDLQNSNASTLFPRVRGNVYDLKEDQPNEPQGFDGIMPLPETYNYVTDNRSGHGLESSGQDPSESNSNFPVSQHLTTGGKFTSTAFCSVTGESCSVDGGDKSVGTSTYRIGVEGSKISSEEVETEALQEGKHPMVGEFHQELDGGSDLKHNQDATVLTKRSNNIKKQDNSLVIHLPNAVPFSDEWLAAIEAAGEEILTMKCGAVQHSPPDKSLPEPSPWSPVKKKSNQIGPYDCTKYTNAMPSNPH